MPTNPSSLIESTTQEQTIARLRASLRPGQREIADWQGGPLAVSAVPGAGKSTGMAVAAAIAIARHQLHQRRQLVVVTFTRSAAASIKGKIRAYLKELALPLGGFSVQTLHGLAWAIARAHPDLAGISPDSALVSPNQSNRLLRACVEQWIAANPRAYQRLIEGRQFDGEETERLRRQSVLRTEVLPDLASTVIREAKSSGLLPEDLRVQGDLEGDEYGTLAIAAGLYEQYQAQLRLRGLIDYDEMILAALRVLANPEVRTTWQQQVFAVFEDEAQDSSPLQTHLLEILAADPTEPSNPDRRNLVRVGDPNQAINSTFTPADPIFFRQFCQACHEQQRLALMTQAGRSTAVIMEAANFTLDWVNQSHLTGPERPFRRQFIQPVAADDPQANANPAPIGRGLEIHTPADVVQTVELIGQRAIDLFRQQPQAQVAVLVRTNEQGRFVARELNRWYGEKLTVYEVGQRDRQSHIPVEMLALLQFLERPHSPDYLKAALEVLANRRLIPTQDLNILTTEPEQFLYPGPLEPPQSEPIQQASRYCRGLLRARLELPLYQLMPFLAYTLEYDQSELATADKLAERVGQQTIEAPSMAATLDALSEIVNAERFDGVEADGEERYTRPGQLTVITMHKAKGLDWDGVFLPFLHENQIPGSQRIPPQAQFLGNFTLAEVARAQIRANLHGFNLTDVQMAWERAGDLKAAEEFRLLYVAMTRARQLLWMSAAQKAPFTWNKPENMDDRPPCPVIPALVDRFPNCVVS